MKYTLYVLLALSQVVYAGAREVDEFRWEGVERIVAVGDLHGDYDNYLEVLRLAGLVDKKGKWSGGKTHLVQTGDIPDRGPDTQKIIDHIIKLTKQAKRKGGRVHSLIGNHETMNMYGDLRYVHPGEYAAFVNRNSEAIRDRYYEIYIQNVQKHSPDTYAALPENYREEWNSKYPLGWVEHRQAWDPAWSTDGKYGSWVLEQKVAIQVNDAIFLHGGISAYYCQNSLESITTKARENLRQYDPATPGILEDENGPFWYRGLSGVQPEALPETVDAILTQHGAKHIVVGHTPTGGVIWPRYEGKVLMIDTGISKAYGGHVAYLEITPEGLFAGYPHGKLPIPVDSGELIPYLEQVIEGDPESAQMQKKLQELTQQPDADQGDGREEESAAGMASPAQEEAMETAQLPICDISQ
jgi:hypothetical protein